MNSKEQLNQIIKQALKQLVLPQVSYTLSHPASESHGDFACNVALVLFPTLNKAGRGGEFKNPRALAEAIVSNLKLKISNFKFLDKVEVAGPGFLNFTLSPAYLLTSAASIIDNQWEKPLVGQKISVEYTDPNPFKEFHIGHLYSNIIGEAISRIYEANGAVVWRADFYGDTGMHIAKSLWGLLQKMQQEHLTLIQLEGLPLKDRQNLLGQGYAAGTIKYDEDQTIHEEINQINLLIHHAEEHNTDPIIKLYQAGLQWSLDYFETYYQRLETKFNGYYPESVVGKLGLEMVEKALQAKILEIGEGGAVVYKGEKDGLHTRVFRNQLGLPTYEAKDLGLVKAKYADFKFDRSLNIFGKEIDEYYKVVKKVLEQIEPALGKKQFHLAHGMVNLPTGKMSSRSGNVVTVEWLLNQSRDLAFKLINNPNLPAKEKEQVAEMVGQAAIKYALLMSNIGDNVIFDFEKSVTFNGNSGPYLQYTHARCHSVITRSGLDPQSFLTIEPSNHLTISQEEASLLHWFYRFPEVIAQAANDLAPHLICTYLYELAQKYNSFYNKYTILGSAEKKSDHKTIAFRVLLTAATSNILKNGLYLLGIKAPEKM